MIRLACDKPENPTGRHRREVFGSQDLHVLRMLARGMTREDIGAHYRVTSEAVSFWIRAMKSEVMARTDAHLVAIAKEQGLIP